MEKILGYLMNEIQWEKETSISFEIDALHQRLLIDIDLPEIEDIPNKKAIAIERGLKINIKNRTSKETKDDYIDCVFSILFRATGLCFAALPTIQEILISGFTQRPNQTNGQIEDVYIVSAIVERAQWNSINFNTLNKINPFLCFQQFKLNCHANQTGELCQIEPLNFLQ